MSSGLPEKQKTAPVQQQKVTAHKISNYKPLLEREREGKRDDCVV